MVKNTKVYLLTILPSNDCIYISVFLAARPLLLWLVRMSRHDITLKNSLLRKSHVIFAVKLRYFFYNVLYVIDHDL